MYICNEDAEKRDMNQKKKKGGGGGRARKERTKEDGM